MMLYPRKIRRISVIRGLSVTGKVIHSNASTTDDTDSTGSHGFLVALIDTKRRYESLDWRDTCNDQTRASARASRSDAAHNRVGDRLWDFSGAGRSTQTRRRADRSGYAGLARRRCAVAAGRADLRRTER